MKKIIVVLCGVFLLANSSCEKQISSYNSSESHNQGADCMACHTKGGSGAEEGRFYVAGTVYDTSKVALYPNTTIELYTGVNGTGDLVTTIEVDNKANFYTNKKVKFKNGLFPTVIGAGGIKKHMSFSVTTGSCNSCHGISTTKLWAE